LIGSEQACSDPIDEIPQTLAVMQESLEKDQSLTPQLYDTSFFLAINTYSIMFDSLQ